MGDPHGKAPARRHASAVGGERIIDKPELPAQGVRTDNEVYTEVVAGEMHLKRGTVGRFEVFCDEAARIAGTDKYPSPRAYLAMAVGF